MGGSKSITDLKGAVSTGTKHTLQRRESKNEKTKMKKRKSASGWIRREATRAERERGKRTNTETERDGCV